MLKAISRPQPWKTRDHICHACLLRLQRKQDAWRSQQQVRWNSNTQVEVDDDSWEASFNNLSDQFATFKQRSKHQNEKPFAAKQGGPQPQEHAEQQVQLPAQQTRADRLRLRTEREDFGVRKLPQSSSKSKERWLSRRARHRASLKHNERERDTNAKAKTAALVSKVNEKDSNEGTKVQLNLLVASLRSDVRAKAAQHYKRGEAHTAPRSNTSPIFKINRDGSSLYERLRESSDRMPWGGIEQSTSAERPNGVSFNSLREADKMSPEAEITTAINSKPYGLRSTTGEHLDSCVEASHQDPAETTDEPKPEQSPRAADNVSLDATAEEVSTKSGKAKSKAADPAKQAAAKGTKRARRASKRPALSRTKSNSKARAAVIARPAGKKGQESEFASSQVGDLNGSDKDAPLGHLGEQSIGEAMKPKTLPKIQNTNIATSEPAKLNITVLDVPQPPVPFLEYGLDRVLFNPGVSQLQDSSSRVYNFDPYLQKIMPVLEFDFDSLKQYKTSSQDEILAQLARDEGTKYIGSTSSMTSTLSHFHFLLSNWRPVNLEMLSTGFVARSTSQTFTEISRAPSAIFLRWKDGTYAIDADKEYDSPNILMQLGKSMELLLTRPTSDYERYRKSDPRQVSEEEKTAPESYQYTTMGDFLMRSQLDAYDPRLPGNGTFDLKTRAVVSVRHRTADYEPMTGYEIYGVRGKYGSYEREYYDMMRATMLKYMLQARMGQMNGIFVAYHNVKRIFGFQYIPMSEMDTALHGQSDRCLGDQEFKASLQLLNQILNKATTKFPRQSLRLHFETQQTKGDKALTSLHCFAEPVAEDEIDRIQESQKARIAAWERDNLGKVEQDGDARTALSDVATVESSSAPDHNEAGLEESAKSVDDENLKPLFYATVIVQSLVNGAHLEAGRPVDLRESDTWTIDYLLQEFDISRHEWALYEDMKARRKHALWTSDEDEDGVNEESEGRVRQEDSYIRYLRLMAERGKQHRERLDRLDEGRETVRVTDGLPEFREEIDGVEAYMGWLYGTKSG